MISNYYSENRVVYEIMRINMVQPDGLQITISYDEGKIRFTCRTTKARIQTRNRATMVTGKCHTIPVYVNCPLCFFFVRWHFLRKFSNLNLNFMKDKNRGSRMNLDVYG